MDAARQLEDAAVASRFLKSADLQLESSISALRQALSTRSVISTLSSYAARCQKGPSRPEILQEIGQGLQGIIFERTCHPTVLKKEKQENTLRGRSLRNEFYTHLQVYESFDLYSQLLKCRVSVPLAIKLITEDASRSAIAQLPEQYRTASDLFEMGRVLPLPKIIRKALIDMFYPLSEDEDGVLEIRQGVLDDALNNHCLVRPYLGMNNKTYTSDQFSLRNFILSFESLKRLDFEVEELAECLGKAYAIMHWGAHINGDDVEFVLGSSTTTGPDQHDVPSFQHRRIGLYLIDFGQCDKVDMNQEPDAVYQAFKGSMVTGDNACFIPNHRQTPDLFKIFKKAYSQAAQRIVEHQGTQGTFDITEFMNQYQEYVEDFF